jgi:glyoxylate reductase
MCRRGAPQRHKRCPRSRRRRRRAAPLAPRLPGQAGHPSQYVMALPLVVLNQAFHPLIQARAESHPSFRLIVRNGFALNEGDDAKEVRALLVHPAGSKRVAIDAALLSKFPNLRCVSNQGVGTDHINLHDCALRGVAVGNTPNVLTDATADMAWALLLSAARNVVGGDFISKAPATLAFDSLLFGKQVSGAVIGIVGCGRIGQAIARRALGFNMRVVYNNRRQLPAEIEASLGGARLLSLLALCAESDFIVLAAPSSSETKLLFGTAQFAACRKDCILVNIGRGDLVDQTALANALKEGQIRCAALDVTSPEPLPRDHEMLQFPPDKLIITPHTGSATFFTRSAMFDLAIENLLLGLKGERMVCPVFTQK